MTLFAEMAMGSWSRDYWQNAEANEVHIDFATSGMGCACPACSGLQSEIKFGNMLSTARAPTDLQGRTAIIVDQGPQFLGDDIADNTSTTTSISVGGSLSSAIQSAGDVDYIRINLVAGQTYTFSLTGLSDSYVELRDSSGALVAENDDGGIAFDSFLMYRATTTGTFYVVARHYSPSVTPTYPVVTGNYTLSVNTIPQGEPLSGTSLPNFSWDEAAIQISRSGYSWAQSFGTSATVTYSYRSTAPATMPDDTAGFTRFSAAQITAAEAALAAWASVANITFVRVNDGDGYSNNAAIVFGNYSSGSAGAAAFAYNPSTGDQTTSSVQGDVWINSSLSYNATPVRGEYGSQVLLHEIGHALGLNHPGDYNAGNGGSITYGTDAVYFADSRMFTVMSYFSGGNTGANTTLYASLPQLHDIAAIQRLYGANITTRTGDTIYGFNSNTGVPEYTIALASQAAIFTVWDNGGIDTLDFSGYSTNNLIDLRAESYSNVGPSIPSGSTLSVANVTIARGVTIENVIGGSGEDTIIGNAANNIIDGGFGGDMMSGGLGNDAYFVNAFSDLVTEASNEGVDSVNAGLTYALTDNVENLTLTGNGAINGTGNGENNTIIGNSAANTLTGLAGNDWLDGGIGSDVMSGGADNDVYIVDNAGDVVTEAANEGRDTVYTSIQYTLGANVDDLAISGTSSALNIYGNGLANLLVGNGAQNTLDGGGGADTLVGQLGDDLYVIDDVGDVIIEGADGGRDTIYTAITYYQMGDNVEDFQATSNAGSYVVGNSVDNLIVGLGGADTLIGGVGADTLVGAAGDDSYIIADQTDVIIEGAGGGRDTIYTSISYYQMGDNVEDLSMTGTGGTYAIGNSVDNLIVGNIGADTLDGGGGGDFMVGGAGDDSYFVDNLGDRTVESAGQGRDTIYASISWTTGDNVEDLALQGSANLNASGNALNNLLVGNDGNNILTGGGDADVLVGGAGADQFAYTSASEGGDAITDFVHGVDHLVFSAAGFGGGLISGGSAPLVSGSTPSAVGASFLYDTDDGRLFWDSDGAGGLAATLIATLQGAPTLSQSDIIIGP